MKLNKRIYWILMIIGIIGVFDFVFLLTLNIAFNVGTILPIVIGVFLIILSYLKLKGVRLIKNVYFSRGISICLILFIISFVVVEAFIWSSTKDERNTKVDFVVLLGAGLKGDRITATFMNRMENCVKYLKVNPEIRVIVSGGQGIGETISEAEAMKRYLTEKGIKEDRILEEDKATSTFENFKYSKIVLNQNLGDKDYKIMIITNDFHMFRAKMLAKRCGFIAYGMPAKTWWGVFPNSCIREYFAVIKSFLIDK
jgi:uncharacterized SAM-binding protein YcdF (DUF218 family)